MPRTYPFEHFALPKHDTPTPPEDAKARMARRKTARGDGRPHYGHRFAETEEMAHVRQMNAQLEELAGVAKPKLSAPREPERAEAPPTPRPAATAAGAHPGMPIGALPIAATTAPPEPEGFRDLLFSGVRQISLIRHCITDGVSAGFRLAMLPLQAAKLAGRMLSPRRWLAGAGPMHFRPA